MRFKHLTILFVLRCIPGFVRVGDQVHQLFTTLAHIVENVLVGLRDDCPSNFALN